MEPIELLAGLAVEILAVDDEETLVDAVVGLEERRGLEGGERLARAGSVPDIAVAAVLINAVDHGLDGIDLVRAHHQELLLARDEDHVLADHLAERALGEEPISEVVEVGDLGVVLSRELVDWKEPLVRVECEVSRVVVGEIPRVRAVADNEELDEAEERLGVSVTGVVLVVDDLLHRPPRANPKRLELNLDHGDAVDQENDIVAVIAVVRIDAELIDNLEGVLAPVFDVNEGIVERCAVVADERFPVPEGEGGFVHVWFDDPVEESLKLSICEVNAVERLELSPEVFFKRGSIADVGAIFPLEVP